MEELKNHRFSFPFMLEGNSGGHGSLEIVLIIQVFSASVNLKDT